MSSELVKVRLMGSESAVAETLLALAKAVQTNPKLEIAEISDAYPNRRGDGQRRYVTLVMHEPVQE